MGLKLVLFIVNVRLWKYDAEFQDKILFRKNYERFFLIGLVRPELKGNLVFFFFLGIFSLFLQLSLSSPSTNTFPLSRFSTIPTTSDRHPHRRGPPGGARPSAQKTRPRTGGFRGRTARKRRAFLAISSPIVVVPTTLELQKPSSSLEPPQAPFDSPDLRLLERVQLRLKSVRPTTGFYFVRLHRTATGLPDLGAIILEPNSS